jgi:hypothetical protein
MRVAVGTLAGQPHGLGRVVWKVQSEKAQDLLQPRFWMVRVAVGQTGAAAFWERARLARPRRVVRAASFMVATCWWGLRWSDFDDGGWLWRRTVPGSLEDYYVG